MMVGFEASITAAGDLDVTRDAASFEFIGTGATPPKADAEAMRARCRSARAILRRSKGADEITKNQIVFNHTIAVTSGWGAGVTVNTSS